MYVSSALRRNSTLLLNINILYHIPIFIYSFIKFYLLIRGANQYIQHSYRLVFWRQLKSRRAFQVSSMSSGQCRGLYTYITHNWYPPNRYILIINNIFGPHSAIYKLCSLKRDVNICSHHFMNRSISKLINNVIDYQQVND